jgi:hypothetical protein
MAKSFSPSQIETSVVFYKKVKVKMAALPLLNDPSALAAAGTDAVSQCEGGEAGGCPLWGVSPPLHKVFTLSVIVRLRAIWARSRRPGCVPHHRDGTTGWYRGQLTQTGALVLMVATGRPA